MRKLYLLALAAGAAMIPAAAMGQAGPGQGQGHGAGHSWREGAAPAAAAPAPVVVQTRQMHRGPGVQHGGRGRFGHIQRIQRGGFVPGFWWGPQFVVRDWNMYGFPQPFHGGRWIRYYDDALLIDGRGRVHDGRYGHDWSRHGDRWGYDRQGVPVYVGDGDYEPRDDDYEWAERWERGDRDVIVRHDGPMPDDCGNPCTRTYHGAPPPLPRHGGYGHGYGYGCGCGPVVVTETVTTTAPVVEQVTTYEYVTEYVPHRAKAAPKKRKAVRRAPAPAKPRPGERG
jgi:Ni/Co efflux regulator RcnB